MSYHHQVTFKCDACETHYMIDEEIMELPPGWIAAQIVMSDTDGCIPDSERELFCHFCGLECMSDFVSASEMRKRLCTTDEEHEGNEGIEDDRGESDVP